MHLVKGENNEYFELCITRRRWCYSCLGINNEEIEIVKLVKYLQ
jgi:hypothetical protein